MNVWVLVFYMGQTVYHGAGGGPAIVDNLASKEECLRVAELVKPVTPENFRFRCIEVTKAMPEMGAHRPVKPKGLL